MSENHPSKDIMESKGTILRGKTICLCLTGSVAVISSPIIARELMRLGDSVDKRGKFAAKNTLVMNWVAT